MGGSKGLPPVAAAGSGAVDGTVAAISASRRGRRWSGSRWWRRCSSSSRRSAGRVTILELHTADDPQPPDFNAHRVCLLLDGNLIVVRTPVVG